MKRGFTLIEVLIVVIILGILATVALPQFAGIVEKARGAEAITNVAAIRTGMGVYALEKQGSYAAASNAAAIKGTYSVEITEKDWNFAVTAVGAAATITATRASGAYSGNKVYFNEKGSCIGGTWPYTSQFQT